jgi:hypothetical protein
MLVGTGATIPFFTLSAPAYRPFDGTDAAVADVDEIEIELQAFGWQRDDQQKTLITPGVRFNYGFAERWEFVAEGQLGTPLSPSGPSSFAANGVFLKYVIKPGVLQDQTGLSIATEFGPLLPEINGDRGVGFSWGGIVSQGLGNRSFQRRSQSDPRPARRGISRRYPRRTCQMEGQACL